MGKVAKQEEPGHHGDRGDEGAVPDALWSTRWTSWPFRRRDEYLASVVTWGPLSVAQACQLLQGHLPAPHGWDEPETCLAEYESLVGRFKTDVERGAVPRNPTADELAAWCDAMHAQLPRVLVEALQQQALGNVAPLQSPQSSAPLNLPSWVPSGLINATNASAPKPKRGRPQTARVMHEIIVKEAGRILMENARAGKDLTLRDVADQIGKMGIAPGMKPATIVSRLKGKKLPVKKAQQTAADAPRKRT